MRASVGGQAPLSLYSYLWQSGLCSVVTGDYKLKGYPNLVPVTVD